MPKTDDQVGGAVRAVLESVLAVPFVDRSAIVVRGKDRTSWLNGLVTCELAKLGPNDGAYGLVVEKKGRIQADFFFIPARQEGKESDAVVLAVPKDIRESLQATLDHYLVMEDAELELLDLAIWHLHGPSAGKVVDALGSSVPYAGKLDVLGKGGAVVALPIEQKDAFEARLTKIVEDLGGAIADESTWERIRIEHGLPRFGVEVDTTLYPQEASLEKLAVSFEKGCYLGQEVVYMLENRGHVKRKLVPLDVEGEGALTAGDAITTPDGTSVGEVKSSVVGPSTGKPVAIGMIKWAQTKPGTELRIGDRVARVRGSA